jgi:GH24 family phage-related lysozyme (muramidase)
MNTSDAGIKAIQAEEAVIDGLYDDPVGYATFGVGHLVHAKGKWSSFLLAAAYDDDNFSSFILTKWKGSPGELDYLSRQTAFAEGFGDLKAAAETLAKANAKGQAKAAVDEEARLLALTPEAVLRGDLGSYESSVQKVKVSLAQAEFDALVSFAFNVGTGAFSSSGLRKEIDKGRYRSFAGNANPPTIAERKAGIAAIEADFLKWNKAAGKVHAGLTRRRQNEANAFLAPAKKELADVVAASGKSSPSVPTYYKPINACWEDPEWIHSLYGLSPKCQ